MLALATIDSNEGVREAARTALFRPPYKCTAKTCTTIWALLFTRRGVMSSSGLTQWGKKPQWLCGEAKLPSPGSRVAIAACPTNASCLGCSAIWRRLFGSSDYDTSWSSVAVWWNCIVGFSNDVGKVGVGDAIFRALWRWRCLLAVQEVLHVVEEADFLQWLWYLPELNA